MSKINSKIKYILHHPAENHCHIASIRIVALYWLNEINREKHDMVLRLDNSSLAQRLELKRKYYDFDSLWIDTYKIANMFGLKVSEHFSNNQCTWELLSEVLIQGPLIVMGRQFFLNFYDYYPDIKKHRVGHFIVVHTMNQNTLIADNPYDKILDDRYFDRKYLSKFPDINKDKGEDFEFNKEYLLNFYWDAEPCKHILLLTPNNH